MCFIGMYVHSAFLLLFTVQVEVGALLYERMLFWFVIIFVHVFLHFVICTLLTSIERFIWKGAKEIKSLLFCSSKHHLTHYHCHPM